MRFTLPEDKKPLHQMRIQLRWGDMDAFGHINNTLYFRYFESARVEWLREQTALNQSGLGLEGGSAVVVNAFCNFLKQLTYPGDIVVQTYVHTVGRSSFDCYYELSRTDQPGVVYAEGGATTVWIDADKGSSIPLPAVLRRALEA